MFLWMTNALQKTFKKEFMHRVKKIVWTVFSMQVLSRPKIALLNLSIHKFSYSERIVYLKSYLKRSSFKFKENYLSHFSLKESLLKPKTGKPNLDFHQCFCYKRLFYSKWHLKRNYYMVFEENHSSRVSETRTLEI